MCVWLMSVDKWFGQCGFGAKKLFTWHSVLVAHAHSTHRVLFYFWTGGGKLAPNNSQQSHQQTRMAANQTIGLLVQNSVKARALWQSMAIAGNPLQPAQFLSYPTAVSSFEWCSNAWQYHIRPCWQIDLISEVLIRIKKRGENNGLVRMIVRISALTCTWTYYSKGYTWLKQNVK